MAISLVDTVKSVMDDMVYRRWRYELDGPDDHWKTVAEFEADGGGDCEDHVLYLIIKTGLLEHDVRLRMVIGEVYSPRRVGDETLYQRGMHAWVALLGDTELWCDPTPGWPKSISPATQWSRKATWGRDYDPSTLSFTDKFSYGD